MPGKLHCLTQFQWVVSHNCSRGRGCGFAERRRQSARCAPRRTSPASALDSWEHFAGPSESMTMVPGDVCISPRFLIPTDGFKNRPMSMSPIRSPIWRRRAPTGVVGRRHHCRSKRFLPFPVVPSDGGLRISRPSDSSALALLQVHFYDSEPPCPGFVPDLIPGSRRREAPMVSARCGSDRQVPWPSVSATARP